MKKKPKYEVTCEYCELYFACMHYNRIPKENVCPDWEIAYSVYEDLPEDEAREALNLTVELMNIKEDA